MKVVTVLGTRPEIIRLSRVIPHLDQLCDHVLVHTGQNYERNLNEIFFKELGLRVPDHILECKSSSSMEEISKIISSCQQVFANEKPDRLLVLGDTNSALSAFVAKRMGIKVFHMEAGNRCFDDRVPEEVNRRVIDHCSDVLMPYTERSRLNLLQEGISLQHTFVTGNPIKEILDYYGDKIKASNVLTRLRLKSKKYFLVTLHRAENVDVKHRITGIVKAFGMLADKYKIPVICSLHPRTRSQLNQNSLTMEDYGVRALDPLGLLDFVHLEKNATCVLTDSGTVQEECCIFNIPNVTIRDVTERPETIDAGSNIITGADPESILNCVRAVLNLPSPWVAPTEYLKKNVSATVTKIVLGY